MSHHLDASVELLAELVKERLQDLRRELQQKVELAIKIAAGGLSQELMVLGSPQENNGHAANEQATIVR